MPGFSQSLAQAIYAATLAPTRTPIAPLPAAGAAGVYCSLHTAAPTDAAGGNEATYSGYARVNIAALMTSSTSGASPETSVIAANGSGPVTFPASSGSTQTVSHWAIWDHPTATAAVNLMYSGLLSSSRSVQSGDVVVIPTGTLTIVLS